MSLMIVVVVLALSFSTANATSPSTFEVLERIAAQGFGAGFGTLYTDKMDTLILWGLTDPPLAGIEKLPYPKVLFDSGTAMRGLARKRCLIFMEINPTKKDGTAELLNNAFVGSSNHFKAKYVILTKMDNNSMDTAKEIVYFFDAVSIVEYALVMYVPQAGTVSAMGYGKGTSKFINISPRATSFAGLFDGRLRDLPLRAIVTVSKPFVYMATNYTLMGLDVEIAELFADKMGVQLSYIPFPTLDQFAIQEELDRRSMDLYLTRRGCNPAIALPQRPLLQRSYVRLMIPQAQRINYNLQFLKPYRAEVWYLMVAIVSIGAVLNRMFRRQLRLNVLLVIVFGYGHKADRLTALLVVVIQILKFILLEAYLGQVTSFMVRLRYQENPQTLEQFFASNILINEPGMMLDLFVSRLSGDLPERMRAKFVHFSGDTSFHEYQPGYAYIVSEYASDTLASGHSYESLFNSSFFYILNEPLLQLQVCYYFAMWSKFETAFAQHLGQLHDNGIMAKLMSDAWRFPHPVEEINASSVLLFSDLVPIFVFVCYGVTLSIVSFVGELVWFQVTKRVRILTRFS